MTIRTLKSYIPNDYNYPIIDIYIDGNARDLTSIYGFTIVKNQLKEDLDESYLKDVASYIETMHNINDKSLASIYDGFNASLIEEDDNNITAMVTTNEIGVIFSVMNTKKGVLSLKFMQKEINDKRKDILISEAKRIIKEFKKLNNINE